MRDDEELAIIKARTMHDVIEPIDGGRKRLLFLSGRQPATIANSPSSIAMMLKIFAGGSIFDSNSDGRPQLVINLLFSGGFQQYTKHCTEGTMSHRSRSWAAGMKHGRSPFLGPRDGVSVGGTHGADGSSPSWEGGDSIGGPSEASDAEQDAEGRIDRFMEHCLVPLAIRTHAIVLCDALSNQNVLSASFTRISTVMCRKFGEKPPFTVISVSNDTVSLYCSASIDEQGLPKYRHGFWRSVVDQSRSWRGQDAAVWRYMTKHYAKSMEQANDLDENAQNTIVVHSADAKEVAEYTHLMASINRFLSDDLGLPAVAVKTGFSHKRDNLRNIGAPTLAYCVDLVNS